VCAAEYFDRDIKRRGVRFENLKELHFVDYLKHAPVSKMWIKHHFGKPSPDLNVVFCAESVRAVTRAVLGGLGIGVIPEHMIEEDLGSRHLRRVVKGRELINQITLARRLERPISGREKAFVDFYKKRADLR
ncbi:MAG: LysR substrate-binding domain-containing protein, partial [Bdellovibrionales bacterium]